MTDPLDQLQQDLGYRFSDPALLTKALTHSSTGQDRNYERLEFVGDRVLGLVMAQTLFSTFPDESEGGLAKRLSALVQGRTLAEIAAEIDLGRFILLSDSERESGGADNENILSDVMESVIAAIYLDGGLDPAAAVIKELWGGRIHTLEKAPQDPKTELQEWVQARGWPLPVYDIADRSGPDHAPIFVIKLSILGHEPVTATGPSRRQAEKKAAEDMLTLLKKKKIRA
jgi:ribonuclease-3